MTANMRLAMVSLASMSLSRDTPHDNFVGLQGRIHKGQTIRALINAGYAEATKKCPLGYPLTVILTRKLTDYFQQFN